MTERRLLFGAVAGRYDAYRPRYPQQMVDDVLAYAGPDAAALRVLEVGAGTGIATRQFAPCVAHLTAVEPDAEMAAAAAAHPDAPANVTQLQGDFEHAQLPGSSFDLLISGTAWHWVSPAQRAQLAARALEVGGALAAFWNGPRWPECSLQSELIAVYERSSSRLPEHTFSVMHPGNDENSLQSNFGTHWDQELQGAPFKDGQVRVYPWTARYTAQEYTALISTHSDHMLLPETDRAELLAGVSEVINGPGGGLLELPYRTLLCLARRA